MFKQLSDAAIVHVVGRNSDSDTGDDLWDGSAAYPFPTAAASTTVVSSDANDDGNDSESLGTGAQTVTIEGLNSSYAPISQTIALNGTSAVTCTAQFLRVHRVYVATFGSGATNAGAIDVKHGSTILADIPIGQGATYQGVYTLPDGDYGWLVGWRANSDGSAAAKVGLQYRPYGGVWQPIDIAIMDNAGGSSRQIEFPAWRRFAPKTDFRLRAVVGGNSMDLMGEFWLLRATGLALRD